MTKKVKIVNKLKTKRFEAMKIMEATADFCYGVGSLLEFSQKLMIATQDSNKIKTIDNGDGTRSIRSSVSDKLLLTFRS